MSFKLQNKKMKSSMELNHKENPVPLNSGQTVRSNASIHGQIQTNQI